MILVCIVSINSMQAPSYFSRHFSVSSIYFAILLFSCLLFNFFGGWIRIFCMVFRLFYCRSIFFSQLIFFFFVFAIIFERVSCLFIWSKPAVWPFDIFFILFFRILSRIVLSNIYFFFISIFYLIDSHLNPSNHQSTLTCIRHTYLRSFFARFLWKLVRSIHLWEFYFPTIIVANIYAFWILFGCQREIFAIILFPVTLHYVYFFFILLIRGFSCLKFLILNFQLQIRWFYFHFLFVFFVTFFFLLFFLRRSLGSLI